MNGPQTPPERASFLKRLIPQSGAARVFAVILLVYTALFFWLACRKFDVCNSNEGDTAGVDYVFWSPTIGKFFWHFDLQGPTFEMHQEPLILLLWLPYRVLPAVKTLLLINTLCLAMAGLAIYLLARKVLGDGAAAVLIAVAYLFYPSIASQHVNQLHSSVFPVPFLMFALYFFVCERFGWYSVFLLLACLGKENVALTAFMFAPYALLCRRKWKWLVVSALVPIAIFALDFSVIRPYFAQGRQYIAMENFGNLGNSFGEVVTTALTNPGKVMDAVCTEANAFYVFLALQAVGWVLPFFALELIFLLPDLMTNLVTTNSGLRALAWHYNLFVGSFLVASCVFSILRIERWLGKRFGPGQYRHVLAGILCACSLSSWWIWFSPEEYEKRPEHDALYRAFAQVPPQASLLMGPNQIMGHLSHRDVFSTPDRLVLVPEEMYKYNWVLFDMNFTTGSPYTPADMNVTKDVFMSFATNDLYAAVFDEQNVFVFRRREPFPESEVRRVRIRSKTSEKW